MKTNTTTNQNIINLIPLKKEYLKEQANNFNETYFQDGVYGYANFAANYSFKDRVKCIDLARNMV